ncbi:MAG TPA: succinylglutamate desuccinylase/aspartoacylase family protein [Methanobacterium sp.]|nr:succinylglutamate desuccinylase/aspartoacylase family protein [Methanobacterium sp.]
MIKRKIRFTIILAIFFAVLIALCGVNSTSTNQAQGNNNQIVNTPKLEVIVTGTGGDVTKNSYIKKNIPISQLNNQVVNLAKSGTPMITFGDGNGPKVMITAGVHGNELPAQIAAMRMINYLNGKQIHGTVYIIPFVAPSDTAKNTRFWNGKNLNEVANVAGTPSNQIINKAKFLQVNALGDFHSSKPGGVPGKNSVFCTKAPTYESYNIANSISKQTGFALISYSRAGVEYPGAVEDVSNLAGIPAVTCEVLSSHGIVASGSVDKSYNQMMAFLKYENII